MRPNEKSLIETLKSLTGYLDSALNVVTNIYRTDYYNDYPFFYQYVSEYLPRKGCIEDNLLANGISSDKNEALIKTVMETLERWHLSNYDEKELVYSTYQKLKTIKGNVLDPKIFQAVSDGQLRKKKYSNFLFSKSSRFYWARVNSLNGGFAYLPAQLIHFMYNLKYTEPVIRLPDSTGAAAGSSIEQALYAGICELIERDAYSISYGNKLPGKRLDTKRIRNKEIESLINHIKNYHFKLLIFDITLDIQVPVFMSLLIDKTDIGPKISVGVKCSIFWEEALKGAIMESLQSLNSTRSMMAIKGSLSKSNFSKIGSAANPILSRMLYWAKPGSLRDINFLLASPPSNLNYETIEENKDYFQLLQLVRRKLQAVKINDIYWKQVTPQTLEKFKIFAVKVVIPKLQPISLNNSFHYFSGERLYNIPVKLGLRKKPVSENRLNTIPHPLP